MRYVLSKTNERRDGSDEELNERTIKWKKNVIIDLLICLYIHRFLQLFIMHDKMNAWWTKGSAKRKRENVYVSVCVRAEYEEGSFVNIVIVFCFFSLFNAISISILFFRYAFPFFSFFFVSQSIFQIFQNFLLFALPFSFIRCSSFLLFFPRSLCLSLLFVFIKYTSLRQTCQRAFWNKLCSLII